MPKIDIENAPIRKGAAVVPQPLAAMLDRRWFYRLGDAAGLTQFGVNLVTVEPGAVSAIRHWHLREDEFAILLEGELTLDEDGDETTLRAGDCAAWKAGDPVGHRFVNRSNKPARFLVIGGRVGPEVVTYTETDLVLRLDNGQVHLSHHDGSDWIGPRDLAPKGDDK